MANISFDLAGFNNFIREAKINLSETDLSGLNTIFSECDTVSEAGEKRADGKLTGDEMREFFSKLTGNLKTLVDKYLISTNEEYAKEANRIGAEYSLSLLCVRKLLQSKKISRNIREC